MPSFLISSFQKMDVRGWRNVISTAIREHGTLRSYARREVIFHQGVMGTAVYAVESGLIETSGLNQAGREVTLSIRGPGEPFGYSEAVLGRPRSRQASVLQDATIWQVATDAFLDLVAERPDVVLAMLGSAMYRLTLSTSMRTELRGTSAYDRVGYVLAQLANGTPALAQDPRPQLHITHEEISRVCDLSRQTVTTILGEMQDRGIVRLGLRSIELLDRSRLSHAAEELPD